jgi:hypothetical protein
MTVTQRVHRTFPWGRFKEEIRPLFWINPPVRCDALQRELSDFDDGIQLIEGFDHRTIGVREDAKRVIQDGL